MDYEKLKEVIAKQIKENGKREITGPVLQAVLMAMVDSLGEVYPHTYTDEEKAQARANIDALSNHNGEITKEKLSLEVQAILNDVANKQNISDATLATIAKTIVGAINEVYKGGLEDASIATSKIKDGAVTDAKIANGAVTTPKIANDAVTTEKVYDGAITEPKLDTDLVNIITSAVQPAELASAIATALTSYVAKADIVDTTGSATDKVMSQHGVTEAIDGIDRLLNYDEILLSMVFGKYLRTDGENESTDTKRAYCDTYFKVSAEKYKIENSAAYTITLYFYNQDKSLHSVVGWFSAGVTEFTSPVDGYVRMSIGDTNAITLDNYVPLHITRESELNAKLKMAENSITLFNPFIGKSIIHHINVERDSNIGVPSQSLYDIAYAKSLGAMVIEANTQKTSDGVWVIKHGQSGKLGKGLNFGNSGYTENTSFSDANSEVLRNEVSYVSNDVRFNGSHIPTLAEFCAECNRLDMSVLLQVKEKSILDEARKYLPDNRIIAYALPERGDFRGFMTDFVTSSDKDEILKSCLAKGYPYIFSWANYPTADKALVKEVVKALHENGFLVSTAYLTPNQTLDAKEDGLDMIASTNWISNPESSGNFMELYDGSTNITYESGASYDQSTKTITMPAGSRLYIYNAQVGSMYMNYTLEILYNGKLDISMGNGSVTAQSLNLYYSLLGLESNGERIIQFSQSNLFGKGTMLLIIAREDTTIKNLHFIASRKM